MPFRRPTTAASSSVQPHLHHLLAPAVPVSDADRCPMILHLRPPCTRTADGCCGSATRRRNSGRMPSRCSPPPALARAHTSGWQRNLLPLHGDRRRPRSTTQGSRFIPGAADEVAPRRCPPGRSNKLLRPCPPAPPGRSVHHHHLVRQASAPPPDRASRTSSVTFRLVVHLLQLAAQQPLHVRIDHRERLVQEDGRHVGLRTSPRPSEMLLLGMSADEARWPAASGPR